MAASCCFLLTFPGVFVKTSNKQPCEIRLYVNNNKNDINKYS